jgi:hypothetical protein
MAAGSILNKDYHIGGIRNPDFSRDASRSRHHLKEYLGGVSDRQTKSHAHIVKVIWALALLADRVRSRFLG